MLAFPSLHELDLRRVAVLGVGAQAGGLEVKGRRSCAEQGGRRVTRAMCRPSMPRSMGLGETGAGRCQGTLKSSCWTHNPHSRTSWVREHKSSLDLPLCHPPSLPPATFVEKLLFIVPGVNQVPQKNPHWGNVFKFQSRTHTVDFKYPFLVLS